MSDATEDDHLRALVAVLCDPAPLAAVIALDGGRLRAAWRRCTCPRVVAAIGVKTAGINALMRATMVAVESVQAAAPGRAERAVACLRSLLEVSDKRRLRAAGRRVDVELTPLRNDLRVPRGGCELLWCRDDAAAACAVSEEDADARLDVGTAHCDAVICAAMAWVYGRDEENAELEAASAIDHIARAVGLAAPPGQRHAMRYFARCAATEALRGALPEPTLDDLLRRRS